MRGLRWFPLWLLPQLVLGGPPLHVLWSFPRTYQPPPTAFLITYTAPSGQDLAQMSTAPSPVGACAAAGDATPDAYCTQWPTCPPPGIMTFWVQAAWSATDVSDQSEPLVVCLFAAETPCVCHDPATYAPPLPPPGTSPTPVEVPPLPPGEIPPVSLAPEPSVPPFAPVFPPGQA